MNKNYKCTDIMYSNEHISIFARYYLLEYNCMIVPYNYVYEVITSRFAHYN